MDRTDTAEQLFDLIFLLRKRLVRHAAQHSKPEFSPMQMHVLFTLCERGCFTMSELAGEVLIAKQQLTPLVDRLVSAGLVLREPDQEDRRVVKIRLSPAGRDFLAAKRREAIGLFETRIACLDERDLERLSDALGPLQEVIRKLP
ncbi:MarR family winged helix-turn-helix transcriptional regulator [Anaeroselena agilis]|uniref:MarR family transcriptional regulator n=1 Tax=Anaeroselena agilis TaxID=3063788 RepID=A0ABU3P1I0_9FIRM|nr:MarR family transcriptional regulator [Selenomonadales bacterium 4137-cl]